MKEHKHDWHFVKIYYKEITSVLIGKSPEQRYATFICSECGLLKEVEVKNG